ncbi:hypothetical protein TUM20983_37260 [Mycobacterium antarcticum]|nr:hypothetical protein TUM20983_37260 [Mycolicibacterium sp. TUM20983]
MAPQTASVAQPEGIPPGAAILVVTRGPNAGSRFSLEKTAASAGRHPDSDIVLDDATVSRRHAEFRWNGDALRVLDVGSLNGTYVNRELIDTAVLVHGDELRIGKFHLVLVEQPPR